MSFTQLGIDMLAVTHKKFLRKWFCRNEDTFILRWAAQQDNLQRDLYSNTGKIVENVNEMYAYRRHFVSLGVLTILKLTYLHFYKTIFVEISCE